MTRQIDKTKRKVAQLRRRFLAAYCNWVEMVRGLRVGKPGCTLDALRLIRQEGWSLFLQEVFRNNVDLSYADWLYLSEDAAQECCDAFDRAESLYEDWFHAASKLIRLTGKMPWELSKHYFFKVADLAALAI